MSEQDNTQVIIERGMRAKALLDNPIYMETLAEVQQLLGLAFLESQPEEQDKRDQAYNKVLGLREFHHWLTLKVQAGEQAKDGLEPAAEEPVVDDFDDENETYIGQTD